MVEVEAGLEGGLEAVGAQQEELQPVEGPVGGPLEAHNYEAYDGVSTVTIRIQIYLGLVLLPEIKGHEPRWSDPPTPTFPCLLMRFPR
jgi:hypothetical protein